MLQHLFAVCLVQEVEHKVRDVEFVALIVDGVANVAQRLARKVLQQAHDDGLLAVAALAVRAALGVQRATQLGGLGDAQLGILGVIARRSVLFEQLVKLNARALGIDNEAVIAPGPESGR